MVLTGKQALDFSGGVSAEDNFGIGGFERIMGPNGQGQYWAPTLRAGLPRADAALRAQLRRAGRAVPAPSAYRRPESTATCARPRTRPSRAATSPPSATSSPPSATPSARSRSTSARCMRAVTDTDASRSSGGRAGAARRRPWSGTRTSAASPSACSGLESRTLARRGASARRRTAELDVRHAVPAVVAQDRPGDQRGERQPPRRRARQPVRLRRLAGVDAPLAAGVRRGDRPGGDQLPRPDRVRRRLALPRRRVRRVLQAAQRPASRSPPSRAPTPRSSAAHPPPAVVFVKEVDDPHRAGSARGCACASSWPQATTTAYGPTLRGDPHDGACREAGRGGGRVRRASTTSSGRWRGLGRPDHPAQPTCGPTSSTRSSAGWRRHS